MTVRITAKLLVLAAIIVSSAAACLFPTDACGCTPLPPPFSVQVAGAVTRADGTPAAGVPIGARVHEGACLRGADGAPRLPPGGALPLHGGFGTTDAQGRFATTVGTAGPFASACLVVLALRVSSVVGMPPDTLAAVGVAARVRHEVDGRPADTVRVVLTLP